MPPQEQKKAATVRMRHSDGSIWDIPENAAGEAEANGMVRLDTRATMSADTGPSGIRGGILGAAEALLPSGVQFRFPTGSEVTSAFSPSGLAEAGKEVGGGLLNALGLFGGPTALATQGTAQSPTFEPLTQQAAQDVETFRRGNIEERTEVASRSLAPLATALPSPKGGLLGAARSGASVRGKPFPQTRGMLNPQGLVAKAEKLVEDIPLVGTPIRKAREAAMQTGKERIAEVAADTAGIEPQMTQREGLLGRFKQPSAAGRFTDTVQEARQVFKTRTKKAFKRIESLLTKKENIESYQNAVPKGSVEWHRRASQNAVKNDFLELLDTRQRTEKSLYGAGSKNLTGEQRTQLLESLDKTNKRLDDLFSKVDPNVKSIYKRANEMASQGFAIEEFQKALLKKTKGLPSGKQAIGAKHAPQEVDVGSLLEQVKQLNQIEKGRKVSTLERAFGKQGAQDILQTVELMNRAAKDKGFFARVRGLATKGVFVGAGATGAVLSPGLAAAGLGAGYIFARALASPAGRLALKKWIQAPQGSAQATLAANALSRIAEQEDQEQ